MEGIFMTINLMKSRHFPFISILVVFLTSFWWFGLSAKKQTPEKINGISLESPPERINPTQMAEVKNLDVNWVAVIPYAFSRQGEPEVYFDHGNQWWGERSDGAAEMIQMAKKQNLRVMLKPQIWLHGAWIGDYALLTGDQWTLWEKSYADYILHFATLADSMQVDLFCIGTELKSVSLTRPAFWRKLIQDVRKVYRGKITYCANWDEYQQVDFWDSLDYIGVSAYFPLSQKAHPSQAELVEAWEMRKVDLWKIHERYSKPVLFTEYGYRSADGAAGNQWEIQEYEVNLDLQAEAYEALYTSVWDEPWFGGGFIWKWQFRDGAGGSANNDYTPQDKPAMEVIRAWNSRYK